MKHFTRPAFRPLLAALTLTLAALTNLHAEVRLPAIFSDHMVLQRDADVMVWGWAEAGEEVSVGLAGQVQTTKADVAGKWRVQLSKLADLGPHTLTVEGHNKLTIRDVLVGEVWLASGQSNMEMRMSKTEGFADEQANADCPQFRMFNVVRKTSREPQSDCQGEWLVCSKKAVGSFSGTAYYFGRELHRSVGVPIGVIHSSHGGSPIEAWTSAEALKARPEFKELLDRWEERDRTYDAAAAQANHEQALVAWRRAAQEAKAEGRRPPSAPKPPVDSRDDHHHPAVLFNAMIAPLVPYTLRGAIWYQGESNGHSELDCRLYATQLPELIEDWRKRWGLGEFPFAWVQLPAYNVSGRYWPFIRESMLKSLAVTNTGMAVTIDLGSTNTIHPLNKRDVGIRLSLWARATVYGEDVPWSGPLPARHEVRGDAVHLRFSHCAGGLRAKDGELRGFELAGADRQWHAATARIRKDVVIIESPSVKRPVAVRYAWHFNPDGNLFNSAGLPASPLRTDDWSD
jgi:hypothetical protein